MYNLHSFVSNVSTISLIIESSIMTEVSYISSQYASDDESLYIRDFLSKDEVDSDESVEGTDCDGQELDYDRKEHQMLLLPEASCYGPPMCLDKWARDVCF